MGGKLIELGMFSQVEASSKAVMVSVRLPLGKSSKGILRIVEGAPNQVESSSFISFARASHPFGMGRRGGRHHWRGCRRANSPKRSERPQVLEPRRC